MATPRGRRRRPAIVAALAVAALSLALTGCAGAPGAPAGPPPSGAVDNRERPLSPSATLPRRGGARRGGGFSLAPAADAGSFDAPGTPPRPSGFEVGSLPERVTAPGTASKPVRLEIPAIGVSTPLRRLGLEPDGGMEVPGDFGWAGWFAEGPAPGQVGPSVIAGHVDSKTGPAVFYRLRDLRPGDPVLVERADGSRLRFEVTGTARYAKAAFPTEAVFGPSPARSCVSSPAAATSTGRAATTWTTWS